MQFSFVASNAPEIFAPRDGVTFLPFGEDVDQVDVIILALKKNWGAGSIDKIDALREWLSKYPQSTPRFIIGCEVTIPDMNLAKYRNAARDAAVKALCDEVLKGSTSIGVRGEITYRYLTNELQIPEARVDIIAGIKEKQGKDPIAAFMEKNDARLLAFVDDLAGFQKRPQVFYERPVEYTNDIGVGHPFLEQSPEGTRVCSKVSMDKGEFVLWCEVDDEHAEHLLADRADALMCGLLPFAMRARKDIKSSAPITDELAHNLNETLSPLLANNDSRLHPTEIFSEVCIPLEGNKGVATGMSCGVDSLYSLKAYSGPDYPSMRLTHLYCGNYLYGNKSIIYGRAEQAAVMSGMGFIASRTNISEQLKLPHLPTHFFKTMFGVISLKGLFGKYFYSSTEDFGRFGLRDNSIRDSMYMDLLLTSVFSTSDFRLFSGGAATSRLEKTRFIIDYPLAHKLLNVCLYPNLESNCGKCQKCLRTLLTIDMLGRLADFSEVFDIGSYFSNREFALQYLYGQRNSGYLSGVYKYFSKNDVDFQRMLSRIKEKPIKN